MRKITDMHLNNIYALLDLKYVSHSNIYSDVFISKLNFESLIDLTRNIIEKRLLCQTICKIMYHNRQIIQRCNNHRYHTLIVD